MPPAAQLMAGPNSDRPISNIALPVTTGANTFERRLNRGAITIPTMPEIRVAPKMPGRPSAGLEAMAMLGPMATKVTPMTIGRRTPTPKVPMH